MMRDGLKIESVGKEVASIGIFGSMRSWKGSLDMMPVFLVSSLTRTC